MKTIYTLSTIILIALSLNSKADDKIKSNVNPSVVPVAPFVWGDPETVAPDELIKRKTKNTMVPVAPFTWGSPEEADELAELRHLLVPIAPFQFGEANADIPVELKFVKAVNSDVPVAPFEFGHPDTEAPTIAEIIKK